MEWWTGGGGAEWWAGGVHSSPKAPAPFNRSIIGAIPRDWQVLIFLLPTGGTLEIGQFNC